MELLNNIWTTLTTENEILTTVTGLPFIFLEMYVYMCLFTSVLNIPYTKKQKALYILLSSLVAFFVQL